MAEKSTLESLVHTTLSINGGDYPIVSFSIHTPWREEESNASTMVVNVSRDTFLSILSNNPECVDSLSTNRGYNDSPRFVDITVTIANDVLVQYASPQEAQWECHECHIPLYYDDLPEYDLLRAWKEAITNDKYGHTYVCKRCANAWQARQEPTFDTHTIANES